MLRFTMFRFRRYRVFFISAIFITVALFRFLRREEWENSSMELRNGKHVPSSEPEKGSLPRKPEAPSLFVDIEHLAHSLEGSNALKTASKDHIRPPKSSASKDIPSPTLAVAPTHTSVGPKTVPAIVIPDRKPASIQDIDNKEEDTTSQVHLQYPGRVEPILLTTSPTPIHWLKQQEHFPIPIESLIQIPTGEVKPIPTIQYKFSEESSDAKTKREERQRRVKDEFMRAWNGYKENAWMHDELSPVSGGSRDPFGAWAATLVDSLDTMWIMGLEEEFVKAVRAVATIDFTTCARQDIPVFETTIRYLGGLLGAYDVSGQTHKTLLEKAIELGEILIGAFDTPNRMPNLYYRWKPAFASQRSRASSKSSVAELGTLSMEFTRLSQLTKDVKYYDAIARVTNALEEFQNLGTKLGGIFPEIIDASGCNRSASDINRNLHTNYTPMKLNHSLAAEGKGYEVPMPRVPKEPRPLKRKGSRRVTNLELSVIPGNPSKGYLRTVDDGSDDSKGKAKIVKRVESETALSDSSPELMGDEVDSSTTTSFPTLRPEEIPDSKPDDWDCVPQGLGFASGPGIRDIFSMGAKQDSAYEYFSKQYLLLGGLEDKYRTMFLKTMDSVREYLLYRPMVPDNRDILFSGRVSTARDPHTDLQFESEVTHLTCFLGGMVGMGAKIFGQDADLEIAKKLTDGCVWAYESMGSGIMPEAAKVLACNSVTDCSWSETIWHKNLDPLADERDELIKEYDMSKAIYDAQEAAESLEEESELIIEASEAHSIGGSTSKFDSYDTDDDMKTPVSAGNEGNIGRSISSSSLMKRKEAHSPLAHDLSDKVLSSRSETQLSALDTKHIFQRKVKDMEDELLLTSPGREIEIPPEKVPQASAPTKTIDMNRPLTHEQYVEKKIRREGLAPGFVQISFDKYMLRPEAIESVWYMYRITGDPMWQEKGWVMFEHIIKATQTTYGHSAVTNLSAELPEKVDEMESFWLAETLKYFYLLYSTPDVINLDEWVLNTEAHPFKRPI